MQKKIGSTVAPSTTQDVKIIIRDASGLDTLKNQLVYFDLNTTDGATHRAIGFIHEILTENPILNDPNMRSIISSSDNGSNGVTGSDVRIVDIKVTSVFSLDADGNWSGQKPLPTSPSTGTAVYIADSSVIASLFTHHTMGALSYMGHLRGAEKIPAPLILPDFGGARGASSIGFVGKTGSGKTDFASKFISSMMKNPTHFPLVVDPQGQWGNENGFIISPQQVARAMGREVHNLRVAEHIQLPLNDDNLVEMLTQIDLWAKLGRMAKENRDFLSREVAEIISGMRTSSINNAKTKQDYKNLLTDVLGTVVNSNSVIARIYASEDKQNQLRGSLYGLIDPAEEKILAYINTNNRDIGNSLRNDNISVDADSIRNAAIDRILDKAEIKSNPDYVKNDANNTVGNVEYLVSDDEMEAVNKRWDGILAKFMPLLNLFQSHNLAGDLRKPLAGENGFLEEVLRVRTKNDPPAPYVILDMSPDTTAKAKNDMLGAAEVENMRRLLDNDNIKANILMMVFQSLKEASEEAFAGGGGNLNTQIVFDEAWRYAPDRSENPVIMKLSNMLEGFALDTRKFGIGWTYILQSPTDLRQGIWKQLKFVFAGYGLVGADLARMADLMDDHQTQLKTYKQFVSPDLTGEYPFMMVGSISPLITAQIPLFVNSYTTLEEFVEDNREWMDMNTMNAGKPPIQVDRIRPVVRVRRAVSNSTGYAVGGTKAKSDNSLTTSSFDPSQSNRRRSVAPPPPPAAKASANATKVAVDVKDEDEPPF